VSDVSEKLDQLIAARRQLSSRHVPTTGFTASWLSRAFDMDIKSVQKRLSRCPSRPSPDGRATVVYDLKDAAKYLVEPSLSVEDFMRLAKRADLPATLQQQFWDAMLKRQQYEVRANDLWPTDRVREVLRDTFQTIKFTMQLWADTLSREKAVTQEQREAIVRLVDALQNEIYEALVLRVSQKRSGPQIVDLEVANPLQSAEDDDDGSSLI
jgi:hypothetical protein